jgi:hypothetical protein
MLMRVVLPAHLLLRQKKGLAQGWSAADQSLVPCAMLTAHPHMSS